MRTTAAFGLLLALLGAQALAQSAGCSCYAPEMREKAARDALEQAHTAALGLVLAVEPDGVARVEVLESFKGPSKGTTLVLAPDNGQCPARRVKAREETLVLAFQAAASVCETYDRDHFLVQEFRALRQPPK